MLHALKILHFLFQWSLILINSSFLISVVTDTHKFFFLISVVVWSCIMGVNDKGS